MRKVLIFHDFSDAAKKRLTEKFNDISLLICKDMNDVLQNIADAEIFITFTCSREMIERAGKLKWIQALSAGVDGMPLDYIKERGIILTNARGIHKVHMSEYAIWAMISLARNTHALYRNQLKCKWNDHIYQGEINGSTVGILGLGSIGQEIARKASALGMHVIGVKSTPEKVDYVDKVYGEDDMASVFKESDYIINLLPCTPKTERIINKDFLNLMKDTACFINMGRGGTVNEEDIIKVLSEHKIRAAVFDVFYNEPLPQDSPLWKMDNVILTPHISGSSSKYIERFMEIIEHNLEAYEKGRKMINIVNLDRGY